MTYGHDQQNDVAELYRRLGVPIGDTPELRRAELRAAMLACETRAAIEATDLNDLLDSIAGLCNIVYAVYGAALEWGIDLKPFWDEIHRVNMMRADGDAVAMPEFARILRDQIAASKGGNYTSIVGRSATGALGG